jgi:hypothetical protein
MAGHVEYETWPVHFLGYARSPSSSLVDPPSGVSLLSDFK